MKTKLNKINKPIIKKWVDKKFNDIAKKNNAHISILKVWDIEYKTEIKFNLTEPTSRRIVNDVLKENARKTFPHRLSKLK